MNEEGYSLILLGTVLTNGILTFEKKLQCFYGISKKIVGVYNVACTPDGLALYYNYVLRLVSRLKSVEAIKLKFVALMPEQISTTTMQFLKVPGKLC